MKFQEVAKVFNDIEPIQSRLEITNLLSQLLLKANQNEAKIISYFALGTLNPPYVGTKFNFAQKNAIKVIQLLLNVDEIFIKEKLKVLGDLGTIVEQVQWKNISNNLSVEDVFEKLSEIEKISGLGSQELKQQKVLELLKSLDSVSAKYVIKILTDSLRLGFSDMTLIDAISKMLVGDKSLKSIIENQYNLCADIGLIVYEAKKNGIDGIKKLNVQIGIPIRMAGAERLPTAQEIFDKLGPCIAQPKLDGFRLQVHLDKTGKEPLIRLFSRNLIDMTYMFPDLAAEFLKIDVDNLICEGEAVAFDVHTGSFYPFQETVKRKRKHNIEEVASELPLKLFVFDLLYVNNSLLLELTHEQRREKLIKVIAHHDHLIQIIEEKKIYSKEDLEEYFVKNIDAGLEGLVVKKPNSIYQAGKRNFNWIKLKRESSAELADTLDCVVLGYYYGHGKRAKFGIGAFLVGVYNKEKDLFQTIAKVGTGLSDSDWIELKEKCDKVKDINTPNNIECDKNLFPDVWTYPEIVCEIFADEITLSPIHTAGKTELNLGFALRFPRFLGYRTDKLPTQTTSIIELKEMYQMQYKKK